MITRREFGTGAIAACAVPPLLSPATAAAPRNSSIDLNPNGLTQLKADRAVRSNSLKLSSAAGMWVDHWLNSDQSFAWSVHSEVQRTYHVSVLVAAAAGSRIAIQTSLDRAEVVVPIGTDYWGQNWQRAELSVPLLVDSGVSQVRVHAPRIGGTSHQNFSRGAALLALELLPSGAVEAHRRAIRRCRADATWLGNATYGLMVQWGEWSFPKTGPKARWPAQILAFDVERFADVAAKAGVGYVVWSATWRSYYFPAPIRAIDEVIPGRTCERDLVGELATALRKRGIRLILYYNGITNDDEWHRRSNYRGESATDADRGLFDAVWRKIVAEVGNRYGDHLAGWFIDEGTYPRDFEAASRALKAGHSDRIVAINPWVRCRLTNFQDFWVGEGANLLLPAVQSGKFLSTIDCKTGKFTEGGQAGLQSHGCFLLDTQSTLTDWAIWQRDAAITDPLISENEIRRMARLAVRNRFALTFNIMMYEDGTVSERSLSRLDLMKECVSAERSSISPYDEIYSSKRCSTSASR